MATKVVMAQLSPTMEEGKLIEWKVKEGDEVAQGDVVAEIETDKANMEVEALGSGVLRKILVEAGQTVPVGELIGVIADPDEDIDDLVASAGNGASAPAAKEEEAAEGEAAEGEAAEEAPAAEEAEEAPAAEEAEEAPAAEEAEEAADEEEEDETHEEAAAAEAEEAEPAAEQDEEAPEEETPGREPERRAAARAEGEPEDGRPKVSPVARRIAAENDLDLSSIEGSGPGGRIVKADVEAALEAAPEAAPEREEAAAAPVTTPRLESRVEEASQMRKAIARRLVQSIGPVPHFFLTTEIDMGRALELRADLNARASEGKIGVTDLLLKATAEALARHPEVNASWDDGSVRYHGSVDLGIAVAVDGGLITPVLRDAARKGLRQISVESRDLIERARERKLAPEDYQGATFSVSNLGMYDIDEFTAIINPPEAGILAIGQTVEKPVVVDGQIVVRKRMRVTMSCDHRVVDGATGSGFLGTFKAMLENPLEMIL